MTTIWVDCDGVLADFSSMFLDVLWRVTGRRVEREQWTEWDSKDCICSKQENDQVWDYINAHPTLVRRLDWVPGARNGLEELRRLGHPVRCITSPSFNGTWMPQRAKWLMNAGFAESDIVFSKDKTIVRGLLIDDRPKNVKEFLDACQGVGVLVDQPWNQGSKEMPRAYGWPDVVDTTKEILDLWVG